MKYYFTRDCYWDSEVAQLIRNEIPVKLKTRHKNILEKLLKHNGEYVHHEELYYAMTRDKPSGDWKSILSNAFTRKKESDPGLELVVPEINGYWHCSKKQDGGYIINVPKDQIVDNTVNHAIAWEEYKDIWHSAKYWQNEQARARATKAERLSKMVKLYLQGVQCSWPLIFAPSQYAPVRREIVDQLKKEIDNEVGAIVLTGAGGEGKTTALMQLCAELYDEGKNVLYHTSGPNKFDIPDNVTDGIFLIDNPANTVAFKSFLTKATKAGLKVVIASRSNEWFVLKETLFDDTRRSVKEIEVPKISALEAQNFAQYIATHGYWIKRSVLDLEKLFLKDSYGFLYASMLMATYNADSLEKIAAEIIKKIADFENGKTILKILAAIVFAEQSGTGIGTRTYRALCRYLSANDRDVNFYLRKEVNLNGMVYQTRHETISRLFYKYLFLDGGLKDGLNTEEREDIIIAILDIYLGEIAKATEDYKPTAPRAITMSSLIVQAFAVIDYEETQEFIIQRLFEECQQHGHVIINRVYHHLDDGSVKDKLAMHCYKGKLPIWEIYSQWLRSSAFETISFDTSIDFVKMLCLEMDAPYSMWKVWTDLLEASVTKGKVVSVNEIRGVYKLGLGTLMNIGHWWIAWASFEERLGNLGDITDEDSARWILKEGCEHIPENSDLWRNWAKIEAEYENFGDIDTEYTARWILKEGCEHVPENSHLWIQWAKIEAECENFGDIDTKYTARWILKEGCKHIPESSDLWRNWAKIETECGNLGDIDTEYTARWMLKKACEHIPENSHLWMQWAKIEAEYGEIGDIDTKYTARWILKEGCKHVPESSDLWMQWAKIEAEHGDIGDIGTEYTVCWILKEGCEHVKGDSLIWAKWAEIEEIRGNVGDYSTKYSAAWLYKESCIYQNLTRDAQCLLKWARFAHKNPMYDSSGEWINVEYIFEYAKRTCAESYDKLLRDFQYYKDNIWCIEE